MKLFDDLLEKSAKLADQATKLAGDAFEQSKTVAGDAMEKGKKKIEELNLESDLGKAQKQLGALVYVMHKTGEKNDELLEQYISEIAVIEERLAALKAGAPAEPVATPAEEDVSLSDLAEAIEDAEIVVEEVYAEEPVVEAEEKTEE